MACGKGSNNFATSCSKDRALLVLGAADKVEEDSGVAEDSVAGVEGLEVEGIGREAEPE